MTMAHLPSHAEPRCISLGHEHTAGRPEHGKPPKMHLMRCRRERSRLATACRVRGRAAMGLPPPWASSLVSLTTAMATCKMQISVIDHADLNTLLVLLSRDTT